VTKPAKKREINNRFYNNWSLHLRYEKVSRPFLFIDTSFVVPSCAGEAAQEIALLKYNGGGDWYANPTSLPNLVKYCNENLGTNFEPDPPTVEVGSAELFNYPFVHMTGHGNVVFNDQERENLRNYLNRWWLPPCG
jgi:hypothetical protein